MLDPGTQSWIEAKPPNCCLQKLARRTGLGFRVFRTILRLCWGCIGIMETTIMGYIGFRESAGA